MFRYCISGAKTSQEDRDFRRFQNFNQSIMSSIENVESDVDESENTSASLIEPQQAPYEIGSLLTSKYFKANQIFKQQKTQTI